MPLGFLESTFELDHISIKIRLFGEAKTIENNINPLISHPVYCTVN